MVQAGRKCRFVCLNSYLLIVTDRVNGSGIRRFANTIIFDFSFFFFFTYYFYLFVKILCVDQTQHDKTNLRYYFDNLENKYKLFKNNKNSRIFVRSLILSNLLLCHAFIKLKYYLTFLKRTCQPILQKFKIFILKKNM